MAYVICQPCVGVKDQACVPVCPVSCIYDKDEWDQLLINPDECIDCDACVEPCPVDAIFHEDDIPDKWREYIAKNNISKEDDYEAHSAIMSVISMGLG